jgi:GTP-binding protein LepA
VTIVAPAQHFQAIDALCEGRRGDRLESSYIDDTQMLLRWRLPLGELIVDFFDCSSGPAADTPPST